MLVVVAVVVVAVTATDAPAFPFMVGWMLFDVVWCFLVIGELNSRCAQGVVGAITRFVMGTLPSICRKKC